ncbi:hypothetical protein XF35_11785 [Streptomyces platensis subsp. clarensis]|nr:hypothetical protein [Streptomyces platensis subsp. clarensis]
MLNEGSLLDRQHRPFGAQEFTLQMLVPVDVLHTVDIVGNPQAVDTQSAPGSLSPARPKVGSAMLLRSTDERGRYCSWLVRFITPFDIGVLDPVDITREFFDQTVTTIFHRLFERFENIILRLRYADRPREVIKPQPCFLPVFFANSHKDRTRPQLRNVIVARLQEMPTTEPVFHPLDALDDRIAVLIKLCIHDAAYIFDHHSARLQGINQLNHAREQVPLIIAAELLPSHREGRAWHSAGQEVELVFFKPSAAKGHHRSPGIELCDEVLIQCFTVTPLSVLGKILLKGGVRVFIDLD